MTNAIQKLYGLVGKRHYANDSEAPFRQGIGGDQISNLYGKYYQITRDGQLYHACSTGAGVALSLDVEGTTQSFALYNPASSGVDMVVLEARITRGTTGDLGPGSILWLASPTSDATIPLGTPMLQSNGIIGSHGSQGKALQVVTVQAGDGVRFRTHSQLSESLVTSAGANAIQPPAVDNVDGKIIIPPGFYVTLSGECETGSSSLVQCSLVWHEVNRVAA